MFGETVATSEEERKAKDNFNFYEAEKQQLSKRMMQGFHEVDDSHSVVSKRLHLKSRDEAYLYETVEDKLAYIGMLPTQKPANKLRQSSKRHLSVFAVTDDEVPKNEEVEMGGSMSLLYVFPHFSAL